MSNSFAVSFPVRIGTLSQCYPNSFTVQGVTTPYRVRPKHKLELEHKDPLYTFIYRTTNDSTTSEVSKGQNNISQDLPNKKKTGENSIYKSTHPLQLPHMDKIFTILLKIYKKEMRLTVTYQLKAKIHDNRQISRQASSSKHTIAHVQLNDRKSQVEQNSLSRHSDTFIAPFGPISTSHIWRSLCSHPIKCRTKEIESEIEREQKIHTRLRT